MSESILRLVNKDPIGGPARLRIDVIADLVCPWSYLGKLRLDAALRAVMGPTTITWYPFQLNPEIPAEGLAFDDYLVSKFGNRAALEPALQQLRLIGQSEGARFNFDRIRRVPNTLRAHCLMHQAGLVGRQNELASRLYRAFFEFGEDIGQREVLASIAAEMDLEPALISNAFDDENVRKAVAADESQVRKAGVSGIPNFLVNRRLFVIGAQDTTNLLAAIDRAMFGEESDVQASDTLH